MAHYDYNELTLFVSAMRAKPLLEQAGLSEEVDIQVAPGLRTIRPVARPRAGWAEAASAAPPQGLLDAPNATRFDDEAWSW
jgi:antitoxin MazE